MDPSEFLKDYNDKVVNNSILVNSSLDAIDEVDDYEDYVDCSANNAIDEIDDYEDFTYDDNLTKLDAFGDVKSSENRVETVPEIHNDTQLVNFSMELVNYDFHASLQEEDQELHGLESCFFRFMKKQDYKVIDNTLNPVVDTWNANFDEKVTDEESAYRKWLELSYNLLIDDVPMLNDCDEEFLSIISLPYRDISPEEVLKFKEVYKQPWCDRGLLQYAYTSDICLMLCSYLEQGYDKDMIVEYSGSVCKLESFLALKLNGVFDKETFDSVSANTDNLKAYTQICLSPDSSKYLFLNEHPDFARIVTLLNKYEIAGKAVPDDLLFKYTENKYLLQILQANYDGRFNSNFITMYLEDDSTLADRIANDLRDNVLDWSLVSQLGGNYFVPRIIASLEELYLDTIEVRKIAIENTETQQLFGNYAKNVVTAWVNGEITDNDYYLYCTIALYNNFEDLMKRFIRFPSVYHFNQFAVNCLFIEFTDNCANLPEIGSLIVIDTGKHYSYVGVDSILADVQLFAEALELEIPRDRFKLSLLPDKIGVMVSDSSKTRKFKDINCLKLMNQSLGSLESFIINKPESIKGLPAEKQLTCIQRYNLIQLMGTIGSYTNMVSLMKTPVSAYLKFDRGFGLFNSTFSSYSRIAVSHYFVPLYAVFVESMKDGAGIKMYYNFVKILCYKVLKGSMVCNNENLDELSEYAVFSVEGSTIISRVAVTELIENIDQFIKEIKTLGSIRIVTESAHYVQIRKL